MMRTRCLRSGLSLFLFLLLLPLAAASAPAPGRIDVTSYGAVPDLAYLVGRFAIAAGSRTLRTDAYRFGATRPGQTIIIPGAGPAGHALVSTVIAIEPQARSAVTLADAAVSAIGDPGDAATVARSPVVTVETGTDDTAAIEAAIRMAARAVSNSRSRLLYSADLFFPAGEYLVTGLDLSGISAFGFHVSGPGAHLHGIGAGRVVVDALGSAFLDWADVEIDGDLFAPPEVGLRIGRTGTTDENSAGGHSFDRLTTDGAFTLASVLNENAETTSWISPRFFNLAPHAYAYIADGVNHFQVAAARIRSTAPRDRGQSFDENLFLGPVFFTSGVGSVPLWIANAHRMRVIAGYAANTDRVSRNRPAVILFKASGTSLDQLDLDLHAESTITSVFTLTGDSDVRDFEMEGFRFRENAAFSSGAVFAIDPASRIEAVAMPNAEIDITRAVHGGSGLFDRPVAYTVSGRVAVPDGLVGLPLRRQFSGTLCLRLRCDTAALMRLQESGETRIVDLRDCGTTIRDVAPVPHRYTIPTGLPEGCTVEVIQAGADGTISFVGGPGETLEQAGEAGAHATATRFATVRILVDSDSTALLDGQLR